MMQYCRMSAHKMSFRRKTGIMFLLRDDMNAQPVFQINWCLPKVKLHNFVRILVHIVENLFTHTNGPYYFTNFSMKDNIFKQNVNFQAKPNFVHTHTAILHHVQTYNVHQHVPNKPYYSMKIIDITYQVYFSCFYVFFRSKFVFFLRKYSFTLRKYSGPSEECVFDSPLCHWKSRCHRKA